MYDEHGGFYDHVPPPAATKVSPDSLDTYGVRVPAFVISPWVTAGTVFGHDGVGTQQPLYFDHTSILKTIARRFLSHNPPYLGARYAAANDLSAVVGNQARPSRFLPFIPYTFTYRASHKRLEVQAGSVSPGAVLQQDDPNTNDAQQFNFEDAGAGHVYIRTRAGGLYLTADTSMGVKQDVRYPATGGAPGSNPDSQRWQFTSNSVSVLDRNTFSISNAAFPGKVLQPAGASVTSGVPVVLGALQRQSPASTAR